MAALSIRKLNKTDYNDILVGWWKDWGWLAPERDFLPEDGEGGLIVFDGLTPICAGFIYITNSKASWVDWIISSKTYTDRKNRKDAIKMLISTLTNTCKNTGCKYSYALIKNPSLINVYKEIGYTEGSSYSTEMIKIL